MLNMLVVFLWLNKNIFYFSIYRMPRNFTLLSPVEYKLLDRRRW